MSAFQKSYQSSLTVPKEWVILLYMKREILVSCSFTVPIYKSFVFFYPQTYGVAMQQSVYCTIYWNARCVPNPIQVFKIPLNYIHFYNNQEEGIEAYLQDIKSSPYHRVPSFSIIGITPRWKEVHHKDCFDLPVPSLLSEED